MASHVPFLAVRPDDQFSTGEEVHNPILNNRLSSRSGRAMDALQTPRLPTVVRFSLVCIIGLSLNALLHTLTADISGPELAAVSRALTDNWSIACLYVWKITELSAAWYAEYDFVDLACLTLLNNVPYYFLLNTFYGIGSIPLLTSLTTDLIAFVTPFALLRRISAVNRPTSIPTENQEVAWDVVTRGAVTVLGAATYAIVVYSSFGTWLPQYMVVNFDGLRSVERAHNTALPVLLAIFIPAGYAVAQFIFTPAVSSAGNPGITDPAIKPGKAPFNPETASLVETVAWNVGLSNRGHTRRAEILAKRTAALAAGSFINTFVRVYVTIEGTELLGAIGWASVWAVAAGLVGTFLSMVANE